MIQPKSFHNTGSCCWWNSLVQALLSCEHIISTLSEKTESSTKLYQGLTELVNNKTDNISLLKLFLVELKNKSPGTFKLLAEGQQSASEGFALLLELLDSDSITELFTHSYQQELRDKETQKLISSMRSNNNFFTMFDENDLKTRGLLSCLLSNEEEPKDFKQVEPGRHTTKVMSLKRISPIVVVLLNRYNSIRTDIDLPDNFQVRLKNGTITKYTKKACIDHIGELNGGHYIARGKRGSDTYLFNDGMILKTNLDTHKTTYMTFYESATKNL